METSLKAPVTLQEAIVYFSDADRCREYYVAHRWPDGVTCPQCGEKNVAWQPKYNRWQCNNRHDRRQFTAKTGTIMEDSPMPLDKWMMAMWMVFNCKNGVSSWEIHRALGITQKSAWFMMHRIRFSLHKGSIEMMKGECEADETFIGGKARNMHKDVKARRITGSGPTDKTAVMGILERGDPGKPKDRVKHSKVQTIVVPNRRKKTLQNEVKARVEVGSKLYSDSLLSYEGLDSEYEHQVVDHAVEYVRGKVHTNGMENFWSLTDRTINGTYVSVEPFHLFRYLDEMEFRYNNRGTRLMPVNDGQRFSMGLSMLAGKRITYAQLTGKTQEDKLQPF
jgi:transposase-like protein